MCMNWQKGNYTIEAAILVPLFFGILFFAMNTALSFYGECGETQLYHKLDIDIMKTFYAYQKLER